MKNTLLYWTPRILAILFVAFLCLFSLDGFSSPWSWNDIPAVMVHLIVPFVVLLGTVIAWKKDVVGAVIFSGFALYYVYMVGLDRHWSWYATISGPALVIAGLFLAHWVYASNRSTR